MNETAVFRLQVLATFFLTGLIWTIQLIHYPAFRFVDEIQFKTFHQFHSNQITFIVLPFMLIELLCSAELLRRNQTLPHFVSLLSVILIWVLTIGVSVPIHNQLAHGKNQSHIEKLILTNWARTLIWSARSGVLLINFKNFF